jgi:hypothetical protein
MPKRRRKQVGTWRGQKIRPGERATLRLKVSRSYGGTSIRVPVHVWRGKEKGPSVFISAAVHGDELNGTGTIRRLIEEPPFELLTGATSTDRSRGRDPAASPAGWPTSSSRTSSPGATTASTCIPPQ